MGHKTRIHSSWFLIWITFSLSFFVFLIPSLQASDVDDSVCLDCHDDMPESLERTTHAIASLSDKIATKVACTSCHTNGSVHVEEPSVENIGNPSSMSGKDAREVCSSCHAPHLELDNSGFDVHSELQLNCSSCHKVHGGEQKLLLSDDAKFCFTCHDAVAASFTRRSQHPLHQRNITCLNCHEFTKGRDKVEVVDLNRTCQNCHPQESGPFPYEHDATIGYAVEGSGCTACHEPHGSENDKLLKQKGKELCLQCHMTPPGHETLPALHGSVRAIDNCIACHADIHGSFVSHKLLDPMLSTRLGSIQDCTQCHSLTD